jgi:hypothetical protein
MARGSSASSALRAMFNDEASLVEARDADALFLQDNARRVGFWQSDLRVACTAPSEWFPLARRPLARYEDAKTIGNLLVLHGMHSSVSAHDPSREDVNIFRQHDHQTIQLHILQFDGQHALRQDLRHATEYIQLHPDIAATPYVTGTTYGRMARLALRSGFKPLVTTAYDRTTYARLQSAHWVYNTINGLSETQHPFEPATVYMETADFVARFGGPAANAQAVTEGEQ